MAAIPDHLRYTEDHEWVEVTDAGTVRIGITDFAQDALGDIVYVNLPAVGTAFAAGDPFGEVESTKSVSDVYAPLAGTVAAVNDAVTTDPDAVNNDPYGDGWLIELTLADGVDVHAAVAELLDADGYDGVTGEAQ